MSPNQFNRNRKVSEKLLEFLNKQLLQTLDSERLTGSEQSSTTAVSLSLEQVLKVSEERRKLLEELRKDQKDADTSK